MEILVGVGITLIGLAPLAIVYIKQSSYIFQRMANVEANCDDWRETAMNAIANVIAHKSKETANDNDDNGG